MAFPKSFHFIGEMPAGYEYKMFLVDGQIRIIGAAQDKAPIAFVVEENKIVKVEL